MRLRGKIYGESALWTDDVPVIYRISIVFNLRIDRKMFEKKTRKESISNRKYNGQKMIIPKI